MVFFFTCTHANLKGRLSCSSNADSAFVTKGFCNWKDASVKFNIHSSTKCHKEAVLKMVTLPSTTRNLADILSDQHKQEKFNRRLCFLKVLSTFKFLARQGNK